MKYIISFFRLLSLVGAFYLNGIYNFFNNFPFITTDRKLEFNVALYSIILDIVFDFLLKKIKNFFAKYQTNIEIIAYKKDENPDITHIPEIKLNSTGVTEIKLNFNIEGNINTLKKIKLILNLPNWIQPQSNITQNSDGSYEYIVGDLTGISSSSSKVNTIVTQKIPLIGISSGNEKEIEVELKLNLPIHKKIFCKFKSNSFKLKIS